MSRAFVKESDGPSEIDQRLIASRASAEREDITPEGFHALVARLAEATDPGQHAELERQIAGVRVIDAPQDHDVVAFGATVVVADDAGRATSYRIVGPSEIDVARNAVGIHSPLAQAMLGARAGDSVVWRRPAGDRHLTVVSIAYASDHK